MSSPCKSEPWEGCSWITTGERGHVSTLSPIARDSDITAGKLMYKTTNHDDSMKLSRVRQTSKTHCVEIGRGLAGFQREIRNEIP